MQYSKPSNMKYTDLAIWIDKNGYLSDCDEDTLYKYIYCIVHMIAKKRGYFYNASQYDEFSVYMSGKLLQRYRCIEDKDKIKSVLNYIKGTIYYTKVDFTREFWQENPKVEPLNEEGEIICNDLSMQIRSCDDLFHVEFNSYLENAKDTLQGIVKRTVPYKDKILTRRVYISCLLTFLNRIVLPIREQNRVNAIIRSEGIRDSLFMRLHQQEYKKGVILFKIDSSYTEMVDQILERFKKEFTSDILSMVNDNRNTRTEYTEYITRDFISHDVYNNYDDSDDEYFNVADDIYDGY